MGNFCGRPAKCANASCPFSSKNQLAGSNTSNSAGLSRTISVKGVTSLPSFNSDASPCKLKSFSLNDLKTTTRNFRSDSNLGEGGFGWVFKGWIDEKTFSPTRPGVGIVVAVKKLKRESVQGHKEWLVVTSLHHHMPLKTEKAEVTYLGQLRNENLVKLIGYCCEPDGKLLVYEFMQRGSLENHLFKGKGQPISWSMRINIAINVARGLSFLHRIPVPVIYHDLKASNVLLDSDFNAKLSDFGLARNGPTGDNTHVSTRVVGTRGNAAPECVATGHLSITNDICSFGVMLLELLSGRRALDEYRVAVGETLVDRTRPFLNDKRKFLRIMDTRLEGQYSKKEAQAIAAIAVQCLHTDPKNRPNMTSPCGPRTASNVKTCNNSTTN